MIRAWLLVGLALVGPSAAAQQVEYPATAKVDQRDDYHGTLVADPYRWLEHDTSAAVAEWVRAQNAVTMRYLEAIPYRAALQRRLTELLDFPRWTVPQQRAKWLLVRRNTGLQEQSALWLQRGNRGDARLLLDPNTLSPDGTTRIGSTSFSRDGRYLGYAVSKAGSDWSELRVLETATGRTLPDRIEWVKFSSAAWWRDGFFYSRYDAPIDTSLALSSANRDQRVYYHRLGTDPAGDALVYAGPAGAQRYHFASVTPDERWLVVSVSDPTSGRRGNTLLVRDLASSDTAFRELVGGFDDDADVVGSVPGGLLVRTNRAAPNWRIVRIDPARPAEPGWVTVLPEREQPLYDVEVAGNRLFATYLDDVKHRLYRFGLDGRGGTEIPLPGPGSVSGLSGDPDGGTLYFGFSSFTTPLTIHSVDVASGTTGVWWQGTVPWDPAAFETRQVFYASKDGTRVPMYIVARRGLRLDGDNPTLLYGYGGFNVSLLPVPNPLLVAFLEQGGVYAQPNLRGGGEYGERWHEAGTKERKQNVFDDFIAAAEWLVANRYTRPERLAIRGGSNGGLLVGAAMTQRPELFAVALPAVGVMDMLRYHTFTVGFGWVPDYGSSDDPVGFRYLRAYSPLHNLRDGTAYPATLVTTADHDDRVVPAHSFKFAARLQEAHHGPQPVLIRVETRSGHGAVSTSKALEETTDVYAFMMHNLGMVPRYDPQP
ncbi:MAG: prolyl oligopeptidase family serine peptidase [Gemmatimonadales bacterium]|nr:prolyl oligopeptidase family serine peptidase [Gemmatimonadales bacterium]